MDDPVPGDLRDFILRHIDSVSQLEALLLLRAKPEEEWDVARTAQRLYVAEQEVTEVLARLCADGLLICQAGLYRFEPGGDEKRTMIDRLADLYARHLIPVTNVIHSKPRRIRAFADAFRFRKDR
jgi:Mn-dependent DtxR family transcriptional regulator